MQIFYKDCYLTKLIDRFNELDLWPLQGLEYICSKSKLLIRIREHFSIIEIDLQVLKRPILKCRKLIRDSTAIPHIRIEMQETPVFPTLELNRLKFGPWVRFPSLTKF